MSRLLPATETAENLTRSDAVAHEIRHKATFAFLNRLKSTRMPHDFFSKVALWLHLAKQFS